MQVMEALEEINSLVVIPRKSHSMREVSFLNKICRQCYYSRVTTQGFPQLRGGGEIGVGILCFWVDLNRQLASKLSFGEGEESAPDLVQRGKFRVFNLLAYLTYHNMSGHCVRYLLRSCVM